jgi:hypothetical protein
MKRLFSALIALLIVTLILSCDINGPKDPDPDTTNPTVGTDISFSGTSSTATTVNWGPASDNITPTGSLRYKLVRASASADIDTIAETNAISGVGLIMDWTANDTSQQATGLTQDTTYFFAVLVRDAACNMSLYPPMSVTPSTPANKMYNLNSAPGSEWSVGATNCDWQWGQASNVGPIGAFCYGTNLSGNYGDDRTYANNYVQLGPLDLSGYTAASGFRLTFDAYFHLDFDYDFAQLQYSTNGTTFNPVSAANITGYPYTEADSWSPNYSPSDPNHSPQWRSVIVNLGAMGLNGATTVYFRWAMESNSYNEGSQYPGFYIDNISIGY